VRCHECFSNIGVDEGHSLVRIAELTYRIGNTGRAFLFRRVANTRQGSPVIRKLTTGNHLVRDVFCLCCGTKLGWLYEFTCQESERYKEGKFILERKLVRETEVAHNQLAERLFENDGPASPKEVRSNRKPL
ncbi:hypothetical protein V3C99_002763, partial [Haemonchus contortus]|uniref:Protein yippee-like n=1 Tax=Haemonchus contortus TaxID=6289 RepID=A0A7I4YA52_HAECO